MSKPIIRVRQNGPLVVEGECQVFDAEGKPFVMPANKPVVALCRCGLSANKPFCDGQHTRAGFKAEETAQRA